MNSAAGSFASDKADTGFINEIIKQAYCIAASSDARNEYIGQSSLGFKNLLPDREMPLLALNNPKC